MKQRGKILGLEEDGRGGDNNILFYVISVGDNNLGMLHMMLDSSHLLNTKLRRGTNVVVSKILAIIT